MKKLLDSGKSFIYIKNSSGPTKMEPCGTPVTICNVRKLPGATLYVIFSCFALEKSTLTLRSDGRVERGGGGYRQTDKMTLQLYIVDIYIYNDIYHSLCISLTLSPPSLSH